jgi:hypothetical protein
MAPVPDAVHRTRDPNPRGGLRGGRGLAVTPDRLALAINDRVLVLDSSWQLSSVMSHRWMGGIHDIAANEEGIWVACSDNDLVLQLDWAGRLRDSWHWRADRAMRRALGFGWLPHFERSTDHRDPLSPGLRVELGHLNAVACNGDAVFVGLGLIRTPVPLRWVAARERGLRAAERVGLGSLAHGAMARWRRSRAARIGRRLPTGQDLLTITPGQLPIGFGGPGQPGWTWGVVELRPSAGRRRRGPRARLIVHQPARGIPSHNVVASGDLVVVNETARARVVAVDRADRIVHSVEFPGKLPFPRGLLELPDGRFLVGTQHPAALNVVDLAAERIDECILLPDDRDESPYAIVSVPESFGDPSALPATRAAWGIPGADASAAAPATG